MFHYFWNQYVKPLCFYLYYHIFLFKKQFQSYISYHPSFQMYQKNNRIYLLHNEMIYLIDSNQISINKAKELISHRKNTFSEYFEVFIQDIDYTEIMSQYSIEFNKKELGYAIKPCDIIDWKNKKPIMNPRDVLKITKMDFSEYSFQYEDEIYS